MAIAAYVLVSYYNFHIHGEIFATHLRFEEAWKRPAGLLGDKYHTNIQFPTACRTWFWRLHLRRRTALLESLEGKRVNLTVQNRRSRQALDCTENPPRSTTPKPLLQFLDYPERWSAYLCGVKQRGTKI
jgi:hypothetical protein